MHAAPRRADDSRLSPRDGEDAILHSSFTRADYGFLFSIILRSSK